MPVGGAVFFCFLFLFLFLSIFLSLCLSLVLLFCLPYFLALPSLVHPSFLLYYAAGSGPNRTTDKFNEVHTAATKALLPVPLSAVFWFAFLRSRICDLWDVFQQINHELFYLLLYWTPNRSWTYFRKNI